MNEYTEGFKHGDTFMVKKWKHFFFRLSFVSRSIALIAQQAIQEVQTTSTIISCIH